MKVFAVIVMCSFLGIAFLTATDHAAGHDGCPFMPGSSALCTMNVLDHSDIARAIHSSLLSYVLILVSFVVWVAGQVIFVQRGYSKRAIRERHALLPQPLHEYLSRRGLLHPKRYRPLFV
jgi:hypothetical protein